MRKAPLRPHLQPHAHLQEAFQRAPLLSLDKASCPSYTAYFTTLTIPFGLAIYLLPIVVVGCEMSIIQGYCFAFACLNSFHV